MIYSLRRNWWPKFHILVSHSCLIISYLKTVLYIVILNIRTGSGSGQPICMPISGWGCSPLQGLELNRTRQWPRTPPLSGGSAGCSIAQPYAGPPGSLRRQERWSVFWVEEARREHHLSGMQHCRSEASRTMHRSIITISGFRQGGLQVLKSAVLMALIISQRVLCAHSTSVA